MTLATVGIPTATTAAGRGSAGTMGAWFAASDGWWCSTEMSDAAAATGLGVGTVVAVGRGRMPTTIAVATKTTTAPPPAAAIRPHRRAGTTARLCLRAAGLLRSSGVRVSRMQATSW